MAKKIYSVLALLFLFNLCYSQGETKFWFFGNNAGFDFNSGSPVTLTTSAMATSEGCSTISDASGALLFYTDGMSVWNKQHVQMPNGFGLLGDISTTQSALIVKKPGSNTIYYIFTLPAEGVGNFCYSIVDMSLASGNGDVTTKNTVIQGNVTEKLTAVHNCNGTDIWVTIHEFNNNKFNTYSVSATGINMTPVTSNVGKVHSDVHGQMKFNVAGTRIACLRDTVIHPTNPYNGIANLDLFTFDNATGVISSPTVVVLNNWQKSYGVEFSRDNSKVYASYYDISGINGGNSMISQYDMNAANIAATGGTVGGTVDPDGILRALQLGPDGKIYVSKSGTPFVCVIANPNVPFASVTYSDNAINIDPLSVGNICLLGLPGFIQSYLNPTFPNISSVMITGANTVCSGQPILLTGVGAASYTWNTNATTATIAPTPTANTTYSVIGANGNCSHSALFSVTVNPLPTITASTSNTLLCRGQAAVLTASGGVTYTWNPGGSGSNINVSPTVTATYTITGTGANGCTNTTTITQTVADCTGLVTSSGVEKQEMSIYPNPFSTKIIIATTSLSSRAESREDKIQIVNMLGQTIYSSEIKTDKMTIDLTEQPNGIYFIKIGTVTKKIVKE